MDRLLTKSNHFTEEYCCSVVRIGTLNSVPNSDNLMQTYINGESIVVNKNDVHEGDVMLYVSNECQIDSVFLCMNNMYGHWELNINKGEIERWIEKDSEFLLSETFKKMKGYFGDNGRVRMIRLRGCPSFGVLFSPKAIENAYMCLKGINWESLVGTDFDMIGETRFVKAYVPPMKSSVRKGESKRLSKWDKFDRMVEGQFKLHYDTELLKKHLDLFNKDTVIDVTVKMHGTSFICGNVLVNYPKPMFRLRRMVNKVFKTNISEFNQDFGMVCSSRKVIKNEWANNKHPEGYYGVDIWTEYGKIIYPYLPKGVTVYGEICGYLSGESRMIQKDYDYGCKVGENFLMIYRITEHDEYGLREYSIGEVIMFTNYLIRAMQDAKDENVKRIFNISNVTLYHKCEVSELVYDIEDLPNALAERCNIEKNEPLCINKVPREGVVVRIFNDEVPESFKLKGIKFLEKEKSAIDAGDTDIEMAENL